MKDITLSVVSHRQNALVNQLLADIERSCSERVSVVVTENIADSTPIATALPVKRIVNERIKGFGANHNAAFQQSNTEYFCVCNPDIRLPADPFPPLLETLRDGRVGVVGPMVRNSAGGVEDSARRFPTIVTLTAKLFTRRRTPDYPIGQGAQQVDWVAGMLMLLRSEVYRNVGGFDEAYFLYYEDVDLCRRLQAAGKTVVYEPGAEVIHDARRASRRNPRLSVHHFASALRFLFSD